jgi:uncharacterized transporter YbjL
MNAPFKNIALLAIFSFSALLAQASPAETLSDTLNDKTEEVKSLDAIDFSIEDPFQQTDTYVLRVYNLNNEEVFVKEVKAEEVLRNKELQAMLQNSDFMLSAGNEYIYLLKSEE